MDPYIPCRRFQVKPHSSPWFSLVCVAAIAHRNYYSHLYHRNCSLDNKRLFNLPRNRCRKVLNDAKTRYSEATKSRISSQKLVLVTSGKIVNSVFNKDKSTVSPLFHGSDVLTSSKDKAELLAQNLSANSILGATGHGVSVFPSQCNLSLDNLIITSTSVAKVISYPSTASGADNIHVIVLQNAILSKLFNKCLAESSFSSTSHHKNYETSPPSPGFNVVYPSAEAV